MKIRMHVVNNEMGVGSIGAARAVSSTDYAKENGATSGQDSIGNSNGD